MTSRAHFFGLPRELRDIIYSYLTHDREVTRQVETGEYQSARRYHATVRVTDSPVGNALRVNSQLHDEYIDTDCFQEIAIVIKFDMQGSWAERNGTSEDNSTACAIFARAHDLTMFVDHVPQCRTDDLVTWWTELQYIIHEITKNTPKMSTLRLAIQHHDADFGVAIRHCDIRRHSATFSAVSRRQFLPTPPTVLANMPLAQRGEGYRVCFSHSVKSNKVQNASHVQPGEAIVAFYEVVRAGVYLYSRFETDKPYWTVEEVVRECSLFDRANYTESSDVQSEEERKLLENLPYEMREWKEMRDDEVMMWTG
jgi:hypothetical protein